MKTGTLLGRALLLVTVLAANSAILAAPPPDDTLWVSDDVNATIYHITLDGTVLSSFQSGSISELALGVGADVGRLWAAKEGSNLIVQFDQAGNTLSSFPGTSYDPAAVAPEGVAVDFADGSLWIVDDVTDLVYNVRVDGTLIASFSTTTFDPAAISPQGIAADPTDGTLWLADNVTHSVYNVTRQGTLVSSFPASAFGPVTLNLQGIDVDDTDRSLWLTARNTHTIYNVSLDGVLHSTLDAALFGSLNPTGVALEIGGAWTNVGQALAGMSGTPLLLGSGSLAGGTLATLELTSAHPSAPALLIVGLSTINVPFKGGVIVPSLDLLLGLSTNPFGAITLSTQWPRSLPGGTQFWLQWWIIDAAGPSGFAASNALLGTTPSP